MSDSMYKTRSCGYEVINSQTPISTIITPGHFIDKNFSSPVGWIPAWPEFTGHCVLVYTHENSREWRATRGR